MRLGIISDTHDKYQDISLAVNIFNEQGCTAVLHAGDFYTRQAFDMFQSASFQLIYAKGNHDNNQIPEPTNDEKDVLGDMNTLIFHDTYVKHKDINLLKFFVDMSTFDLIVYGHLHFPNIRQPDSKNHTIVINPGGFYYDDLSTFCIYETQKKKLEIFYKFNGSFVPVLVFKVPGDSFKPMICSPEAAIDFILAYKRHRDRYIPSKKDTGTQWLCRFL